MHRYARCAISVFVSVGCAASSFCVYAEDAATDQSPPDWVLALGGGMERMPKWLGASTSKSQAIPYFDINWRNRVELSSTDGLIVDLVHDKPWHGGLVGTMIFGRSDSDLGPLAGAVSSLNNTHQGGLYLEYDFSKSLTAGARVRHDIQDTGAAYAELYAELDLPAPEPLSHSLKGDVEFMNASAMRRNFGLSDDAASRLGVSSYQPHSGLESGALSYQAFIPTSQHTGFVLGANWNLLASQAAQSPLVKSFGSKFQRTYMMAFMVHY